MQEQEEEKRKIPTPQIMLILLQQLNYTAHKKEAVLQCEESGSKIANLQGFLAGVRSYKNALRDNGYIFDSTEECKLPYFSDDGCEIGLAELREVCSDIDEMTDSADYKNFQALLQKAVDIQKDWLFYTSEKGRDLHFVKGWYEAMSATDATMLRLHTALDAAEKEAAESLPFDNDSEKLRGYSDNEPYFEVTEIKQNDNGTFTVTCKVVDPAEEQGAQNERN